MASAQDQVGSQQVDRAVPTPLLLWFSLGTVGSLLFTTTYVIEGATRSGYDAWAQAVSALSLGPGGWVQQVNFVVFGLMSISTAVAARWLLKGGVGATWYPIIRTIEGLGLVMDGFFSQDPNGYPAGIITTTPTFHAVIHQIFAFVIITSIAVGYVILAPRMAKEPGWRGWAAFSVITGIWTIAFIAIFGTLTSQHSPIAGIFERLSPALATIWGIIFLARLWTGTAFGIYRGKSD